MDIIRTAVLVYKSNYRRMTFFIIIYIMVQEPFVYLLFLSSNNDGNSYLSSFISLILVLLFSPLKLGFVDGILRLINGENLQYRRLFFPFSKLRLFEKTAILCFLSRGSVYTIACISFILYYRLITHPSYSLYAFYMLLYLLVYAIPVIYQFTFGPAIVELAQNNEKTTYAILSTAFRKLSGKRADLLKLKLWLFIWYIVNMLVPMRIQTIDGSAIYKTVIYILFTLVWWVPFYPIVVLSETIFFKNVLGHQD